MKLTRKLAYSTLTFACGIASLSSDAATITQATNNSDWNLAATWDNGQVPTPANDYFSSNDLGVSEETLRVPFGGGTFDGNSLTIVSGTRLLTKGGNSATSNVANLILDGGSIAHGDNDRNHIVDGGINVAQASTIRMGSTTRSYTIASMLTGSADLIIQGTGTAIFTDDVSTFSGSLLGTSGVILDFDESYSFASLNLDASSQLLLDDDVNLVFQGVTFGATSLDAGVYTFAELNEDFDAFLVDGGSGTVTVGVIPEPASLALLGLGGLCMLGRRRRIA